MCRAEDAALALDLVDHVFGGVGHVLTEDADAFVAGHELGERQPDAVTHAERFAAVAGSLIGSDG